MYWFFFLFFNVSHLLAYNYSFFPQSPQAPADPMHALSMHIACCLFSFHSPVKFKSSWFIPLDNSFNHAHRIRFPGSRAGWHVNVCSLFRRRWTVQPEKSNSNSFNCLNFLKKQYKFALGGPTMPRSTLFTMMGGLEICFLFLKKKVAIEYRL